jgi:tetratricopeptide (TPR) repeat protein
MLFRKGRARLPRTALLVVMAAVSCTQALRAQANDDVQALKQRITDLAAQEKYTEALPLLEKVVAREPNDHEMHFQLAFALLAQGNVTQDTEERKALRVRARQEFVKAKELGDPHPVVDALIQSISADGADPAAFSTNRAANDLMGRGEAFFSQGKLDEALADYQKALVIDPKLYEAAVFSGDVYMHRGDWAQSEIWYQKAIAIDPSKETAYRYSATPLMKQGKYDLARDRYVEAYITEPYSRFAMAGLRQWGDVTKTKLGHPKIDIPTNVTFDDKGDAKMDLDAATLLGGKKDGSFAWVVYGGTRTLWHKEKFAKTFPSEKTYRHSLNEEVDALRAVVRAATSDQQVKALSPSLKKMKELDDKGLLEAYVLLARADQGIAADYPNYLAQNRDKLRRYVLEYVVTNGGS